MFLSLTKIRIIIDESIIDGYPNKDIHMLLVNSVELREFLSSMPEFADLPEIPNECRIFGVKVVGNPYLQPGTIAKFFKDLNLDKEIYIPPSYRKHNDEKVEINYPWFK